MPKSVLVIDDDEAMLMAYKFSLRSKKVNEFAVVQSFTSVDAAMESMGYDKDSDQFTKLPDFIITDNNTNTKYKGIDLIEKLKGTGVHCLLVSNDVDLNHDLVREKGGETVSFMDKSDASSYKKIGELVSAVIGTDERDRVPANNDRPPPPFS